MVIPKLYGWVNKTLRVSPLVLEHGVVVITVGSQSRRGGVEGEGEGIKFCDQFEDSDTGSSNSITVKMEYLFVWKTDEGKTESIVLLMLVLLRCLIVGE